jgi:hypothetical protein
MGQIWCCAQIEQDAARAAIERDRREAARARAEWQEKAQHTAAAEARAAAKEAQLQEREDALEGQVSFFLPASAPPMRKSASSVASLAFL